MKIRFEVFLAVFLAISSVRAADKQPLVAVVPLAARSVDSASVAVVEDAIASELIKSHKVRVLERAQMNRILREQGFQQSGACDQGDCSVEMGRLLSVDQILTGSLGRVGGSYSLSLRLVAVKTGEVTSSVTRNQKGAIDEVLTDLLPMAVSELLAPMDQTAAKPEASAASTESSPASGTSAQKESKTSILPWVLGGTAVVGAGAVAAILLLSKSGSSGGGSPAASGNSSMEVVLP
jgi:TolB-like protein